MTSQQFLVCDTSTLANFKSIFQAISTFFSTCGWLQSADTGQVNWSTIVSVPTSGAPAYEVWTPNDGLTNFYVKMKYWTSGSNPQFQIIVGTGTDGAGNLSNTTSAGTNGFYTSVASQGAVTTFECDFSGGLGRFSFLLWRTSQAVLVSIERSVNSSGAYTSSYVTIYDSKCDTNGSHHQQTVFLGGQGITHLIGNDSYPPFGIRTSGAVSMAMNNSFVFDPLRPIVGYLDWPMTTIGCCDTSITDGVTFQTTLYGSLRTYIPWNVGDVHFDTVKLCMRYD